MVRIAWALALCLLPAGLGAEEKDEFSSGEHGFRIRRPDAGWSFTEPAPSDDLRYAMKVFRNDGRTETSVSVFVADLQGVKDAKTARDLTQRARKADARCSNFEEGDSRIADRDTPWFAFDYDAGGTAYRIRQHSFIQNDALYVLQCASPADAFQDDIFQPILDSFEFTPLADPQTRASAALLRRLAARCGSEIDWAPSWQAAAERARKLDRLVVVVVEQYRGLDIDRFAPSTLFMDSDVVQLMNERFVGLLWNDATDAPFEAPDAYGLGPSTFGQGILFADPDGRVVANAVSYDPFYFHDFACRLLQKFPEPPPFDSGSAEERLRRGDLSEAAKLLVSPRNAEEFLLRASLMERLRKGEEALKALAAAEGKATVVQEARIRLRMGQFAKAQALLEKHEDPEARFWRALAKGMQRGIEPIRAELEALAEEHPDDRWAWRGAALLTGKGMASGIDRAMWPERARIEAAVLPAYETKADPKRARDDAIAFLLRTQFDDGSWPSPMSIAASDTPIGVAVTAICGSSLLPFANREGADAALNAALAFVLDSDLHTDENRLFDYTIWAQVFSLRFLAECSLASFGDPSRVKAKMNALVRDLRDGRFADGGWAYFRPAPGQGGSIGFVTAAAVLALSDARRAGAQVPEDLFTRARERLDAMRARDGVFNYMGGGLTSTPEREAEASLRGPLYALALGKPEEVIEALDVYLEHREHVARERGKNLCHTGPEGTASYYLLYGYAFSAEALASVPEEKRKAYREALLNDVLSMRMDDGSFCDNPSIGRHYGAGIALRALRLLEAK